MNWYDAMEEAYKHGFEKGYEKGLKDARKDERHGRWLNRGEGHAAFVECSFCHVCGNPEWKVCSICDTKMDGEREEE